MLSHYFPTSVLTFLVKDVFKGNFGSSYYVLLCLTCPSCNQLPITVDSTLSPPIIPPTPPLQPHCHCLKASHLPCYLVSGCRLIKLPPNRALILSLSGSKIVSALFSMGPFPKSAIRRLLPLSLLFSPSICTVVYFLFIFKWTPFFFFYINVF